MVLANGVAYSWRVGLDVVLEIRAPEPADGARTGALDHEPDIRATQQNLRQARR